ncbi:MAG: DUF4124 domain-containing protein [Deltaproteobacteria bacterium]|nr:DUF4124 domain-containing protein [Deltaproteobacteria bacterium]
MYKIYLSKSLFIIVILIFLFAISSYPKDIYKWVDKDGNLHFTDNHALIPKDKVGEADMIDEKESETDGKGEFDVVEISPAPLEEENLEVDSEEDRENEETLREFWGSRVLEIGSKEKAISEEIENTERQIRYKKREVDYLLINGYSADYSILELRYLDDYLKDLEYQMSLVDQERENLKQKARRQSIPPGYLRP